MIIILTDLTGSTSEMERSGKVAASKDTYDRLQMMIDEFRKGESKVIIDPTIKQIGAPTGDGLMLVDEDHSKLKQHVDSAMRIQRKLRGLSVGPKIAISVGDPIWQGEPYEQYSTLYGTVINLTSRLLSTVCPNNGVVISEGAHAILIEYPEVIEKFRFGNAQLKNLKNKQPYWYWMPELGSQHVNIENTEELLARLEERLAQRQQSFIADTVLSKNVGDLNVSVGRLAVTVRWLCWSVGALACSTMLTWLMLLVFAVWFGKGN